MAETKFFFYHLFPVFLSLHLLSYYINTVTLWYTMNYRIIYQSSKNNFRLLTFEVPASQQQWVFPIFSIDWLRILSTNLADIDSWERGFFQQAKDLEHTKHQEQSLLFFFIHSCSRTKFLIKINRVFQNLFFVGKTTCTPGL